MNKKLKVLIAASAALAGAVAVTPLGAGQAHATTFATGSIYGPNGALCVYNPALGGTYTGLYLENCGGSFETFKMNNTSYSSVGWVDFVYSDTSNGLWCLTDNDTPGHNGQQMTLQGCNGSEDQAFQMGCTTAVGGGTVPYIRTPAGYSLNDYGGRWQPGDVLAQWTLEGPLPKSEWFEPMGYNNC